MSKYYLVQDSKYCIGCMACEIHCKTNKNLNVGPRLCRNFIFGPTWKNNIPAMDFVFMPCFHCEDPWCMNACPTGAIVKRDKDGIVYIDEELCVGCKACISACPFGACQWDNIKKKAIKCDYCMDRIDMGLKPACVTKCVTQCLEFGEAENLPEEKRRRIAEVLSSI